MIITKIKSSIKIILNNENIRDININKSPAMKNLFLADIWTCFHKNSVSREYFDFNPNDDLKGKFFNILDHAIMR